GLVKILLPHAGRPEEAPVGGPIDPPLDHVAPAAGRHHVRHVCSPSFPSPPPAGRPPHDQGHARPRRTGLPHRGFRRLTSREPKARASCSFRRAAKSCTQAPSRSSRAIRARKVLAAPKTPGMMKAAVTFP